MPSFSTDCQNIFGTKDLFIILNLERNTNLTTAKIKKAYYKQSILWHPDRFAAEVYNDDERELATKKFQILSKAYTILSDSEKRAVYVETGKFDYDEEEDNSKDWFSVWRGMFKKVTKEDIEEYLKKFRGSQQEMDDVKNAYIKYKGDMDKIIETVIGADVQNEDRIREIIRHFIELGELPSLPKYKNEKPISRVKRMKRAIREAKQAEKVIEEMRSLNSACGSNEDDHENGKDLGALILANQKKREKQQEDFLAHLEQKYGNPPKAKKSRKN